MSNMTITTHMERTPRTIHLGDHTFQVEELSCCLAFTRKPNNLSELSGTDQKKIYITESRTLTTDEFDNFASNFLTSCDWLRGKGCATNDGFLCVEVTAPGRPSLYVNPEGYDYARYVALLG